MELRRESFPVHSFDVDAFGLLTAPALAGYLQEIAGHHARDLGRGFDAMRERGLAWVLGRQRIEIGRPIRFGDQLEIETWFSGADRLSALRDFVVRRQDGEEVARAITAWFLLDLERRRPVRPDQHLEPRLREEKEHALAPPGSRLPDPGVLALERRFGIRYQDIDLNLHVTNTSYVAWAVEAVPQETWLTRRLRSLEAHYLAECRFGGDVLSGATAVGEGEFAHAVRRAEDGKELCRLRTSWVAREAEPAASITQE